MSLDLPGRHSPHPFFDVQDDCLIIDGRRITELAAQVGRTPFYAYARRHLTERAIQLKQALPAGFHMHYALKANPMPALVAHMAGLVDGIDVASAGEMQLALDCGVHCDRISFAGPGKSDQELTRAAAAGIIINVESEREIAFLGRIGSELGNAPKVAVRVNPNFELKSSGMKMTGGPKPFGIDSERVPAVLSQIARNHLEFRGFHIFTGSQNLNWQSIVEAQRQSVELAIELAKSAPDPVRMLNLGGGFGIPYFPGDKPLELSPIAESLRELHSRIRRYLPHATPILELGRYLVGEAGIYVCKVVDRKVSRGHVFLVTDGGLHHHLAASGNFGQVVRKNYPVLIGNRVHGDRREVASVVGPLCTPLDILADRMDLPEAQPGDLIVVLQSGAYGFTASPHRFLGHPHPAEVLL